MTPTSFLEHLELFKKLHSQLTANINGLISRYQNGLDKLLSTENQVQEMQIKLESLKPVLIDKNVKNKAMLENLQTNQEKVSGLSQASRQKEQCEIDEQNTNIQKEDAIVLRKYCEEELAKVLPLLDEANKALEKIR